MDRFWLNRCVRAYPFQFATALWRAVELKDLCQFLVDLQPQGLGLDIGCGDGNAMRLIKEALPGSQLVGIDADSAETTLAAASGVYRRVHTCSAAEIPEPDGSFDFAVANCVLEHIPLNSLERVLPEISRVLKPGALFVFSVPSERFQDTLGGPNTLYRLSGHNRERYLRMIDDRLAHYHYFSYEEWRGLLEKAGLSPVRHVGYLTKQETRRW